MGGMGKREVCFTGLENRYKYRLLDYNSAKLDWYVGLMLFQRRYPQNGCLGTMKWFPRPCTSLSDIKSSFCLLSGTVSCARLSPCLRFTRASLFLRPGVGSPARPRTLGPNLNTQSKIVSAAARYGKSDWIWREEASTEQNFLVCNSVSFKVFEQEVRSSARFWARKAIPSSRKKHSLLGSNIPHLDRTVNSYSLSRRLAQPFHRAPWPLSLSPITRFHNLSLHQQHICF